MFGQVHLCWLSSPGLEESYHSEQQKLLERIRSLERAAAPGTRQWMCGGSQLRPQRATDFERFLVDS
jgi:hypothetical protein